MLSVSRINFNSKTGSKAITNNQNESAKLHSQPKADCISFGGALNETQRPLYKAIVEIIKEAFPTKVTIGNTLIENITYRERTSLKALKPTTDGFTVSARYVDDIKLLLKIQKDKKAYEVHINKNGKYETGVSDSGGMSYSYGGEETIPENILTNALKTLAGQD